MGEEINQSKAYCDASVTNNLIYCSYQEHTALQNKEAFTMKKMIAMMLAALMILTIGACALADVTLDEAKKIALDKAGVAAEDAIFTKAHFDHEDGRVVADIEFYAGTTEYEMDVDTATGEITEFETEEHALVDANGTITLDAAKQIALAKVGMKEEDVKFTKQHLDKDDGRTVYEIEFVVNGMEYEFDIDAATGAILEFDADLKD